MLMESSNNQSSSAPSVSATRLIVTPTVDVRNSFKNGFHFAAWLGLKSFMPHDEVEYTSAILTLDQGLTNQLQYG